uniref:(northern house mosquito) hypothetical protein n=1 Tax=Culex pipiens TaxID=7175 RepID=A0A8D8I0A5_CULPI
MLGPPIGPRRRSVRGRRFYTPICATGSDPEPSFRLLTTDSRPPVASRRSYPQSTRTERCAPCPGRPRLWFPPRKRAFLEVKHENLCNFTPKLSHCFYFAVTCTFH